MLDTGQHSLFKIYRSSAGSGKTYRLTLEYLKLALRYPEHYRRILAVTFTNKAANEMKSRILEKADELSRGQAGEVFERQLTETLKIDTFTLRERAKETLRAILHGYSYFSVGTIDSFFQRVITAFARDIGIQVGFTIEFDRVRVTEDIIDQLYLELEDDRLLLDWLTRFTETRIEDDKGWDIRPEVRELARQIYYESFHQYMDAFGQGMGDKRQLGLVMDKLRKEREIFKRKLQEYGRKGLAILSEHALTLEDLSRKGRGPGALFVKMSGGGSFEPNSYQEKAYQDAEEWYTKKSDRKEAILQALESGLFNLYRDAIDYYRANITEQNTYALVLKLFYNLGIYSNLVNQLALYRDRNECILISDLSHLLKVIIGENDAPYIYEKAGNYYQHFLIDEFQDTSLFQWNNFMPLIRNALAMGQFNMIVGDVKQSIYRWRGGDWQILQAKAEQEIGREYLEVEALNVNWRSRERVIRFNNTVFRKIPVVLNRLFAHQVTTMTGEADERLLSFGDKFARVYEEAPQQLPPEPVLQPGGVVQVRFFKDMQEEGQPSRREQILEEVGNTIRIIQDHGYGLRDIAVLVRTRAEGKKIADYLLTLKKEQAAGGSYRYDVVSSESLFLSASPAVNAVIHFMQLVVNDQDRLARVNLYYWLAVMAEDADTLAFEWLLNQALEAQAEPALNSRLINNRMIISYHRYKVLPLEDLVEVVIQKLDLHRYKEEQSYLLGLQNVVLDFKEKNNGDLHAFLEWWSAEGHQQSIKPSEKQDAIRIMTIHQAKGLEFEMVLVPFCSWPLDHKPNSTVIWSPAATGPLRELPYYPVKYEKALAASHFRESYFEEMSMAYMDNLNLLYVTLTRAVSGLFVFADNPSRTNDIRNVGDVLHAVFHLTEKVEEEREGEPHLPLGDYWDPEGNVFSMGEIRQVLREKDADLFTIPVYTSGRWYDKIAIRKQPDIFSKEKDTGSTHEKVNMGILLHEILSRILHKEEMGNVLDEAVRAGHIDREDRRSLEDMLTGIWKNDIIEDWFGGGWEVRTEVPVLPRTGEMSRMDRVMLRENKAIVVDYKTGFERKEDYKQVSEYKNILKEMGYTDTEGYLLYLGTGELVQI